MTTLFMERYEAARSKRLQSEHGTKIPEFTIGDLMAAIWSVENEDDARRFFDGYVEYLSIWPDCDDPLDVARSNIGWMFGEGMAQDRIEMWVRCTQSAHPVFGSMATPPTPAEAFEAGKRMAAD